MNPELSRRLFIALMVVVTFLFPVGLVIPFSAAKTDSTESLAPARDLDASSTHTSTVSTPGVPDRVVRKAAVKKGKSPTILIVINTMEKNYSTRLEDIRRTWMQRVIEKDSLEILILGSNDTKGLPDVIPSFCKVGYWEDSCKKADALSAAYDFLVKDYGQKYDWVFLVDDDVYVFPDNLQRMVMSLNETPDQLKAWGIYGCGKDKCVGFCGGGGYLLTRKAVIQVEEKVDRAQFKALRNETDMFDVECGRCGDLVMTRIFKERRNIVLGQYPKGSYVWNFDNGDEGILESLNTTDPLPWLYHYPSKGHMDFIHQHGIELGSNHLLPD